MKVFTKRTSLKNLFTFVVAGLASALLVSSAQAQLPVYDSVIAADHGGALPYAAVSKTSLAFDTTSGAPFDFGAVSGSATIEFVVSGDPVGQGQNGYLGNGADTTFSLRYEQWDDTGQLGFTHGGVADYTFEDAAAASPTTPTHVAYRWDQDTETMDLYVAGALAGSIAAPGYAMPSGAGFLGAKDADGTEGMAGIIDRVTVYNSAIDPSAISSHANAVPEPSTSLLALLAGMSLLLFRRRMHA